MPQIQPVKWNNCGEEIKLSLLTNYGYIFLKKASNFEETDFCYLVFITSNCFILEITVGNWGGKQGQMGNLIHDMNKNYNNTLGEI